MKTNPNGQESQGIAPAAARCELWQTSPRFDPETQREAKRIAASEEALLRCFGTELSFGTGGLRGLLGVGTNRMNLYTVAKATQGLAGYLRATHGKSVAIAYDSRHGSREFAGIVAGVLAHHEIHAWMYDRLMPTPMLSFAVRELHCDAGIMITASHNPAQYNGYKVYGPDGCQITDEAAAAITGHIKKVEYSELQWLDEREAKDAGWLRAIPQAVYDAFIDLTRAVALDPLPISDESISNQGVGKTAVPLSLVYTPLHGTGLEPVRDVLSRMPGIRVIEVAEQCVPDGDFPTCPDPNPERMPALELACDYAKRADVDLVIATDPDCDRVGVASRLPDGDFRLLTGNEVGLLLLEHILSSPTRNGETPCVIKTIVTSDLAFPIAKAHGAEVVEVLTGFKYIGEMIGRMEAAGEGERFAFGFEESCGYLAGTHVRDKDGVMACVLVAQMAQAHAAQGKTLADAIGELYRSYGYMETRLLNFDIKSALPMETMSTLMKSLRENPPALLADKPIVSIKDYAPGIDSLPPSNVLSYQNQEGGKAIIRPSGTEPKVKAYLSAKGGSVYDAQKKLDKMTEDVERWLA